MANSEFNPQLDKVTEKELNLQLREKIAISYNHIDNTSKHITDTEREIWNAKWDRDNAPLATKYSHGMMSKEDKIKLDNFTENGSYQHPTSGVDEGTYLITTVDRFGHVISGSYPQELNITTTNAKQLGGVEASKYALRTSPTFLGTPTCPTAAAGDSSYQLANTQFVSENSVSKIFEVGTIPPKDKRLLWIDTSRGLILKYWNGSVWVAATNVFEGDVSATTLSASSATIADLNFDVINADKVVANTITAKDGTVTTLKSESGIITSLATTVVTTPSKLGK